MWESYNYRFPIDNPDSQSRLTQNPFRLSLSSISFEPPPRRVQEPQPWTAYTGVIIFRQVENNLVLFSWAQKIESGAVAIIRRRPSIFSASPNVYVYRHIMDRRITIVIDFYENSMIGLSCRIYKKWFTDHHQPRLPQFFIAFAAAVQIYSSKPKA